MLHETSSPSQEEVAVCGSPNDSGSFGGCFCKEVAGYDECLVSYFC